MQTAQDNIDLQTTILSRFDLIFIVKDIRKYSQDKVCWIFILRPNQMKILLVNSETEHNDGDHCKCLMGIVCSFSYLSRHH